MKQHPSRVAPRAVVMAFAILLALGVFPVSASPAARDRTPPTAPSNLRVTARTAYSVSLAWNPSSDNSGSFSYVICCGGTNSASVSQSAVSFTFTAGLEAGRSYSFRMYAVDAAGNKSRYSNSVRVTLPADATPPAAPVVSVTEVGSTHVSLAWSSTDNGPQTRFWVFKDGSPVIQDSAATSGTLYLLKPETTYTFTVQARDVGMNWSPLSQPVTVTTGWRPANDVTPPTTPTNLREEHWFELIQVRWDQSTDDLDPQSIIRYDVYMNGVVSTFAVGTGFISMYAEDGLHTITLVAVDLSGNQSAPATIMVSMP